MVDILAKILDECIESMGILAPDGYEFVYGLPDEQPALLTRAEARGEGWALLGLEANRG